MPFNVFLGASVGAAVGAAAVYGYMADRQKRSAHPVTVSPAVAPPAHPALRYGIPVKERIRVFEDHVVGYDSATRNPIWVLEHLNRAKAYGEAKRSNEFLEDQVWCCKTCARALAALTSRLHHPAARCVQIQS
jgi:DNA/RNA endonuclease G (NUC1)